MTEAEVQRVRLGDLAEISSGWSSKRGEHGDVSLSVVQPRNVLPSGVVATGDLDRQAFPSGAERSSVQPGDVVLVSRGSAGAFRAGVVYGAPTDAIITSNLMRLRPQPNRLLAEVLVAFLLTPDAQEALKGRSQGAATYSITVKSLSDLFVPVPPMSAQKTLAALWRATQRAYDAGVLAAETRRALGLSAIERVLLTGKLPEGAHVEAGHGH